MKLLIQSLIIGIILISIGAEDVTYIAAVLEYEPYNISDPVEHGYKVVRENAYAIASYVADAKAQGADIIIAPEYGVQSLENDMLHYTTFTHYVPNRERFLTPCDLSSSANQEAMYILSCAARTNEIYVVADLAEMSPCNSETITIAPDWDDYSVIEECPPSGYYFYNTQVVFDRTGAVIARYRKQNLYLEPEMTPGSENDDEAIFMTDFGVTFTLQICFDLLFEHPGYSNVRYNGIKDVAMSTAWVDVLPIALADGVQNAFSRNLGANLLVSGYHCPERGKLGSGIFKGYADEDPVYTYDKNSGNVLIVSSVTTKRTAPLSPGPKVIKNYVKEIHYKAPAVKHHLAASAEETRHQLIIYLNMTKSDYVNLAMTSPGESLTTSVCSSDDLLCCDLTYEHTGSLHYKLVTYSGHIEAGTDEIYISAQVCGILLCAADGDINTCGHIDSATAPDTFGPFEMTTTFVAEEGFPVGFKTNLLLVDNKELLFEKVIDTYKLSSTVAIQDPLALSLVGRWFSDDP